MLSLFKLAKNAQKSFQLNKISELKLLQPFSSSGQSHYNKGKYTPVMPLKFVNGQCKVYEYTIYDQMSKGYYIALAIGGLITYYFVNKLIHVHDRGILGMIFFSAGTIFCVPKLYQFAKTYSHIIKQIHLNKCGTQVTVSHAKFGLIPTQSKFDIGQISKPIEPNFHFSIVQFAFPVLIDGKLFYLPRDTDFQNEEVLPPILNGVYINTEDRGYYDEIVI